jgi:hypothetical protein
MFKKFKNKKLKLTEDQVHQSVVTAMYVLSDGVEWHIAGKEEESHPIVMESPEVIAEMVVEALFWSPSRKDSSASSPS